MQELIEYFNERPEYDKTSEGYEIIEKAKQLLEKEKEQICNAFSRGLGTELGLDWEDSEQYYNRIYQK